MKQEIMKFILRTVVILLVLTMIGCGGETKQGKAKIEAPELGLSMYAPRGWKIDKRNPRLCFKGDYTGIVIDEPLEGRDFYEYAERLCKEFGGKIVSKTPLVISGHKAIKAIIEYPNQGTKAIKTFIHKSDRIIEVSFVILKNDFQKYESSLHESIESMKIK